MLNWDSTDKRDWDRALALYNMHFGGTDKASIDTRVTLINAQIIEKLSTEEFVCFLEEFYDWKYSNTGASRNKNLFSQWIKDNIHIVESLKQSLCQSSLSDEELIKISKEIKYISVAGATALLSIMYPDRFGTVDKFVVLCLKESLPNDSIIQSTNEEDIKIEQAIYIEKLMREKAKELNKLFSVVTWNARAIDKATWADR